MTKKKISVFSLMINFILAIIFLPFLIIFGIVYLFVLLIKSIINASNKNQQVLATLDVIDRMSGSQFEEYIAYSLLPHLGYSNSIKTQDSADYGVDVITNYQGQKIAIQCKRYQNKVGIEAIQEVIGGLKYYNCSKGMVITNNYFTPNAIKLAEINEIKLIDRTELSEIVNSIIKIENEKVNMQRKNNKKRKIIAYNTQTGLPIYFDQCRLIGYNTQNGNAIYENMNEIIKYDTQTGAPIYKRIEISRNTQNNIL